MTYRGVRMHLALGGPPEAASFAVHDAVGSCTLLGMARQSETPQWAWAELHDDVEPGWDDWDDGLSSLFDEREPAATNMSVSVLDDLVFHNDFERTVMPEFLAALRRLERVSAAEWASHYTVYIGTDMTTDEVEAWASEWLNARVPKAFRDEWFSRDQGASPP